MSWQSELGRMLKSVPKEEIIQEFGRKQEKKIPKKYVSLTKQCALANRDTQAESIMPDDVPVDGTSILVPVKTTGDGNCLFNAASLAIVGMYTTPHSYTESRM